MNRAFAKPRRRLSSPLFRAELAELVAAPETAPTVKVSLMNVSIQLAKRWITLLGLANPWREFPGALEFGILCILYSMTQRSRAANICIFLCVFGYRWMDVLVETRKRDIWKITFSSRDLLPLFKKNFTLQSKATWARIRISLNSGQHWKEAFARLQMCDFEKTIRFLS